MPGFNHCISDLIMIACFRELFEKHEIVLLYSSKQEWPLRIGFIAVISENSEVGIIG